MANKRKSVRSSRLGTQFRGKLAAAFGQRGGYDSNLWFVYSPRTNSDWVLKSDLEWDHFVLSESDPRIKNVNYAPDPIRVRLDDGTLYETTLDAVVTYTDDSVEWREIKFTEESNRTEHIRNKRQHEAQEKAAKDAGIAYTRWSENEVRANLQKLVNWRRIIPWLAAARGQSLASHKTDLSAYFASRKSTTLGELESQWGQPAFPLYAAALFSDMQHGHYQSDLDTSPLSALTVITVGKMGGEHE